MAKKQADAAFQPKKHKKPTFEPPKSTDGHSPVWRLHRMDWDSNCQWGWVGSESRSIPWEEIHRKLGHFESMTWAVLKNSDIATAIDTAAIHKDAQKELTKLSEDARSEIWEFQLMGKQRVWGFREGATFIVLWWDPEHLVFPSKKKHT